MVNYKGEKYFPFFTFTGLTTVNPIEIIALSIEREQVMKKVIIRKNVVAKMIVNDVPNALAGRDFEVGVKVVRIKPDCELVDDIVEACKKYAETKGVDHVVKYWGDGSTEFRFDESPVVMGDWNDPSSRYHY